MSHPYHTKRLHADLETPVSAYLKLRRPGGYNFLFESVEGRRVWARYSILGFGARRVVAIPDGTADAAGDPLAAVRQALKDEPLRQPEQAPAFVGGVFGFLSYDAARSFEPIGTSNAPRRTPDALFFEPEVLAVFDNHAHTLTFYSREQEGLDRAVEKLRSPLPPQAPTDSWREPEALDSRATFEEAVERAKEHIRRGDIIQAVLSRRFRLPPLSETFDVYRGLRTINPSPYLFYFQTPKLTLAGASPEAMLRVQQGQVTVRPIAGTRPRGATEAEDNRLADELLRDPKERAEHVMLVDLGRNDVGRVSVPGSVRVNELMTVERYSHVMHIVSQVEGLLDKRYDAFDALRAAFPAGTLSGAPKVRAMQIIDALENRSRGIYGGAVGYFGANGDADFGIAIRTLEAHPGELIVQAGAGIVADSHPEREADETEHKAQAVFRAVRWATSEQARR